MNQRLTWFFITCLFIQPVLAVDLNTTIICGRIMHADDSAVTLTYLENPITGKVAAHRTVLSASSYFAFRLEISQPVSMQLEIPGASAKLQLFAEAGDSIFLACDASAAVSEAHFSGDGAAINHLLNELS